jgi:ABC-2 type transport system ATP-binding protein
MIEVKDLTKSYNERAAVRGVSFRVARGEILGFLGPNGAGKSTTMKILSGFLPPTSGSAVVNGNDVVAQPQAVKASIGYLPETPPVYTGMQVSDYLEFCARLHDVPSARLKSAVADALEKCGLTEVRFRLIGNLSKGYRQRVGLAQALVHNPPVLILDEPTVGLDPKQIIDIRNLIRGLAGDHTVILSTHILPEVQATCSRVVVIDRGVVVAEDTLDGIARRMQGHQRLSVHTRESPGPLMGRLQSLPGVQASSELEPLNGEFRIQLECVSGQDPRAEVAQLVVGSGLGLLGLSLEKLSLEDAFVRLVTQEESTKELDGARGGA